MNKSLDETINKMLKEIEEKNFEYFDIEKAIQQLVLQHNEIERLNNRIDKAIEHLEIFISEPQLSKYDTLKILIYTRDILKGSDTND